MATPQLCKRAVLWDLLPTSGLKCDCIHRDAEAFSVQSLRYLRRIARLRTRRFSNPMLMHLEATMAGMGSTNSQGIWWQGCLMSMPPSCAFMSQVSPNSDLRQL